MNIVNIPETDSNNSITSVDINLIFKVNVNILVIKLYADSMLRDLKKIHAKETIMKVNIIL